MFNKDVLKLLDIDSLVETKDKDKIIKRLRELEEYRAYLREEAMSSKDFDYREKCMSDLMLTTNKMKTLGSLLDNFETIKKMYGIEGVF